ncbi:MAG: hypothetical protein HYY40_00310 [Bacteroidetes bacterium]|nr:hypothetical protein [Bacteroidota bacterium]
MIPGITEILLSIFYAVFFIIVLKKVTFFKLPGLHPNLVSVIFMVKIFAGVVLTQIYTRYYPPEKADTFLYYEDAKIIYRTLPDHPEVFMQIISGIGTSNEETKKQIDSMNNWYRNEFDPLPNDNRTLTRINALMMLFSFGYYYVHIIFMCFLSLTGLTGLYRFFLSCTGVHPAFLAFTVFLFPSVIFWSSGILKEGLLFFGAGSFLFAAYRILKKITISSSLLIAAGLSILLFNKIYFFAILLPFLILLFWTGKSGYQNLTVKFMVVALSFTACVYVAQLIFPGFNLVNLIAFKRKDLINLAITGHAGSLITTDIPEISLLWIIKEIPASLFTAIFRPHFLDCKNIFMTISFLENMMILVFILLPVFFYRPFTGNQNKVYFLAFFSFSIVLLTIAGITTPVLGALVRYRVPALPFLMVSLLIITDTDKIISKVKKLFGR